MRESKQQGLVRGWGVWTPLPRPREPRLPSPEGTAPPRGLGKLRKRLEDWVI